MPIKLNNDKILVKNNLIRVNERDSINNDLINNLIIHDRNSTNTIKMDEVIFVFDSGIGGLTVLKELYLLLPNERFVYFADSFRMPYGTKNKAEICIFVKQILSWCTRHFNVKAVVMACNTSSALALRYMNIKYDSYEDYSNIVHNIKVFGLIAPTIHGLSKLFSEKRIKKIGIIGTSATIKSLVYQKQIKKISPYIDIITIRCLKLAELIEAGKIHCQNGAIELMKRYIEQVLRFEIDTLVYGCTHYPIISASIDHLIPDTINVIDPANYIAKSMQEYLYSQYNDKFNTMINDDSNSNNQQNILYSVQTKATTTRCTFYTTGSVEHFTNAATFILGFTPIVYHITL